MSFKVPGLGRFIRKGYTRNGVRHNANTWTLVFNHKGQKHAVSLGTADEKLARKWGRKRRDEIVEKVARHEPVGTSANKVKAETLKELVTRYIEDNCPKSLRRTEEHWTHLLDDQTGFSGWRAADISALALDRYTAGRKAEGAANETIRKEIGSLKQAYSLAVEKRLLSPYHIPAFPKLAKSNPRQGFFKEAEVRSVIEHMADRVIRSVILFAILTGWRKSEILSRRWSDVDFPAGEIRLNTSKNGEGRIFPFLLLPELKELMEELRSYTDEVQQRTGRIIPWVFHREGQPVREFRRSWKTAVRNAGLPGRIFHDFRRSAVRNLIRAGVPAKIAMQLTGHKTRSVFERYNITEEAEDLSNAVARLSEYRNKQKEAARKEKDKVAVGNFAG